ncbi:hypothetical protein SODALDRAFT_327480 [Sodiomyces alkalinus F11]|uniref:Uncharacterized protein n=1 Tax=Sodiomyces alkalinus (strain CBS 110278 / VKM F-3762 / F11) TaxID=1314773 RepID=A0A3N2Q9F0_SODAK|nr:hypothetical protein SODALDRAFT_327480 [Sodiomyces alkalinus F11]ROT43288.1 hypothetical protein SODALDRAFT_327480 [Sodiomyces alkalinus F11]
MGSFRRVSSQLISTANCIRLGNQRAIHLTNGPVRVDKASLRYTVPTLLASRQARLDPFCIRRHLTSASPPQLLLQATSKHGMASDEEYMAFLNKANEDPQAGYAKQADTGASKIFKAQDTGVDVPKPIATALEKGDKVYVSDADEPFVAVALSWDEGGKGLPDEVEFAELIQHPDPENAGVELLDPIDWDSDGQYQDLVEAVRTAGKGNDVRVYRVPSSGARVEYWVVTTEGKGPEAKLVGVKAMAVES